MKKMSRKRITEEEKKEARLVASLKTLLNNPFVNKRELLKGIYKRSKGDPKLLSKWIRKELKRFQLRCCE